MICFWRRDFGRVLRSLYLNGCANGLADGAFWACSWDRFHPHSSRLLCPCMYIYSSFVSVHRSVRLSPCLSACLSVSEHPSLTFSPTVPPFPLPSVSYPPPPLLSLVIATSFILFFSFQKSSRTAQNGVIHGSHIKKPFFLTRLLLGNEGT